MLISVGTPGTCTTERIYRAQDFVREQNLDSNTTPPPDTNGSDNARAEAVTHWHDQHGLTRQAPDAGFDNGLCVCLSMLPG